MIAFESHSIFDRDDTSTQSLFSSVSHYLKLGVYIGCLWFGQRYLFASRRYFTQCVDDDEFEEEHGIVNHGGLS